MIKTRKLVKLPRPVLGLLAVVVTAGAASVAVRLPEVRSWSALDLGVVALIVALTFAGEHLHVDVRFGAQTKHVSVTETFYAAALVLGVRSSVLTLGVALGVATVYGSRRIASFKVAYNVGSFLMAVTAAELAFHATRPIGAFAVVPAMAAFFAVNSSTVVGVIAAAEGRSFRSVFGPIAPLELGHAAANLAAGVLLANVWTFAPAALPVLGVLGFASLGGCRVLLKRHRAAVAA